MALASPLALTMLRRLANETEETTIIDAVEDVIATNQTLTPNLDNGGSRN